MEILILAFASHALMPHPEFGEMAVSCEVRLMYFEDARNFIWFHQRRKNIASYPTVGKGAGGRSYHHIIPVIKAQPHKNVRKREVRSGFRAVFEASDRVKNLTLS